VGAASGATRARFVLSSASMYAGPPPLTDADRCPHCGARAVVVPSATLRWVCGVCGGARVLGLAGPPDAATVAGLVGARQSRAAAFGWRVAVVALLVTTGMCLVVAALIALASRTAGLVLAAVGVAFAILALSLRARRARALAASAGDLDAAYAGAAETIARARGGALTSGDLARAMKIDEPTAEAILTSLSVQSRVRVDVGDDAQLQYRAGGGALEPADALDAGGPSAQRNEGTR
jgi:hypothetical protein